MKSLLLIILFNFSCAALFAQSNVFPASGNVGIGTTSPVARLQLGNFAQSDYNKRFTIPGTYNFEQLNISNGANGNGIIEFVTHESLESSGGVKFYTTDGAHFYIQTASPSASYSGLNYTTKFVLNNNGNVGIGTTDTKGYKLAVAGNMIAESVKVKLQVTWPDFVFQPSHKMPALAELEKFITENKHLPNIPSAHEVEKEGINLGEMNAKLLQKIEELTLHLIEKDKQITLLSKEFKLMNQKLDNLIK